MCHVSCVMCHLSHVTYCMSHFFLSDQDMKLFGGGSVINKATQSSFHIDTFSKLFFFIRTVPQNYFWWCWTVCKTRHLIILLPGATVRYNTQGPAVEQSKWSLSQALSCGGYLFHIQVYLTVCVLSMYKVVDHLDFFYKSLYFIV